MCIRQWFVSKSCRLTNYKTLHLHHLVLTRQMLPCCHLKVTPFHCTSLPCLDRLPDLWPLGTQRVLWWGGLSTMQPDSLSSPETQNLAQSACLSSGHVTVSASRLQRSALDWCRLEQPWQTKRIMLQFLASAACSKWIPISKHTRRTSRGGKLRRKRRFCARLVVRIRCRWSEQKPGFSLALVSWSKNAQLT